MDFRKIGGLRSEKSPQHVFPMCVICKSRLEPRFFRLELDFESQGDARGQISPARAVFTQTKKLCFWEWMLLVLLYRPVYLSIYLSIYLSTHEILLVLALRVLPCACVGNKWTCSRAWLLECLVACLLA